MKKETIFKLIIAILLGMNLFQLVGFLLLPKSPHFAKGNFNERAFKILDLNDQQERAFLISAKKHREAINDLIREQKDHTAAYFDQPSDSILNLINQLETKKINITATNFNEIENLLEPKQKGKFKEFKKEALQVILK